METHEMKMLMGEVFRQLESDPHPTLPGLRRRYYWRGNFRLIEYLTPKAVAWNVARLRRLGEHEHADRLQTAARGRHPRHSKEGTET
jgi:hypothetical protein